MDAAVNIMGAHRGTLKLVEGDSLLIVAHHGHQRPYLDFFNSAEGRVSVGEAMKCGERVIIEDVESSPIFVGSPSLAVLREAGVRAINSTPLRSRNGALLGILTTQWSVPHEAAEHDLWRVDLLVRQAADLIDWDGSRDSLGARQLIADIESLMGNPPPRTLSDAEAAPREKQTIPEPSVEEARAVDRSAVTDESSGLSTRPLVRRIGSTSIASARKLPAWWKRAAVGVFIVIAVLGAFLWFGKKHRLTSAPEVAAVKPAPVPTPSLVSLGLSGDRQEIGANETLNVTLKGQYSDGTQKHINEGVQWHSSEPRVATIDDQGRVTARQAGETKITARYRDRVSPAWMLAVQAEKPVLTVTAPAEKPITKTPVATKLLALTVSASNREIKIQERLLLRVKARYSDGNEKGLSSGVEWRSSDRSVATVDSRGELLALRAGKIAVVARWGGIESLAVDIIVKEPTSKPPPAIPVVEPSQVPPTKPPVQSVNVASYINRAKGYRVQGNYTAALAELEKARTVNPGSQEVADEIEATRRACNAEQRLGREGLTC